MAAKYDHIRAKAIQLRTEQNMTLEDICERLQMNYSTVWYWIKDIPIPTTEKQKRSYAQLRRNHDNREKYAAIRQKHYDAGWAEAETLLKNDLSVRDFVLMYIGEGSKRSRNEVSICNSDPAVMRMAYKVMQRFTTRKPNFQIQIHVDHDEAEMKDFWSKQFDVSPEEIRIIRKSNSNQLSKRQFRSIHGVCAVRYGDTYFRARLQAWMDFIKSTW